ncbi:trigger factor [Mycoplasma hafezii]|uniref:trigger factor n=1 Tax=Mycoplasma hafezii TaxID=525886 RepID=UPI003CEFA776
MKHELLEAKSEFVVSFEISKDEVQKEFDKRVEAAAKNVKVPGYRPGKAPKEKRLARVDYQTINSQVTQFFFEQHVNEATECFMKEENKLGAVSFYEDLNVNEDGSLTLKYIFVLKPEFTIKLEDLKTKMDSLDTTQEVKDEAFAKFLKQFSVPVEVETEAKEGDVVNINFKGFINNEPFEGGEAEGYDLTLGSKSFIPGFEEQLVGKSKGWEGDINVTFPADYFSKEYQGKDAKFEIKVNSVKRTEAMDLTDTIVAQFGIPNIETVAQFREWFDNREVENHFFEVEAKFLGEVIDEVATAIKQPLHERAYSNEAAKLEAQLVEQLKAYKIKKSEYLQIVKSSEEELKEQFKKQAEAQLTKDFATQWVLSQLDIQPTPELLEKVRKSHLVPQGKESEQRVFMLVSQFLAVQKLLELTKSDKTAQHEKLFNVLISK